MHATSPDSSAPSCILPKYLEDKRTIRGETWIIHNYSHKTFHVATSAFTSPLWCHPLAASFILFIPENGGQITWFLLFNYITASPGLAQHLLAMVQHESSGAQMGLSAERERGEGKKRKEKKSSSWDAAARSRRWDNEAGCMWRLWACFSSLCAQLSSKSADRR